MHASPPGTQSVHPTVGTPPHTKHAIAILLPQFHPIPENDAWWGRGFTEWRNVAKAAALFPGHEQPRLPADLGFYDLRLPEARAAQAELAQSYGISGFCYYHYWFNGRRLLERPFAEVLRSGEPDFPFCLCWANENWSRIWNGSDRDVLVAQQYSVEDDEAHMLALLPALADRRYIRLEGKPLLIVYRVAHMKEPRRRFERWRETALREGLGELVLAQFESFAEGDAQALRDQGLDLSIEFAPDWRRLGPQRRYTRSQRFWHRLGLGHMAYYQHRVSEYADMVERMSRRSPPDYPFVRCVTPGFDNSPRRAAGGNILAGSSPAAFGKWFEQMLLWTDANNPSSRRLIFINAWNEWAEGNHLEPDLRHGLGYLEAAHQALQDAGWR